MGMKPITFCPFCGGIAKLDDEDAYKRKVGYTISCDPCYVHMWAFAEEKPDSLIKRWNNRMTPPKKIEAPT